MSYLVLARKWRPQTFEDVIGQGHVVRTLQNAFSKGRIAHGFLFTGARGVGKTTVARLLAKAMQCEQGPTAQPCGSCPACTGVADGRIVDVLEIDGASNRGIDQVRELREGARYMPQAARFKIIIIDEVHMLTTEAFNALLKILEEPPAHVKFIFATTEPHRIPVTILSRCQRYDFKRIGQSDLASAVKRIAAAEEVAIDEEALHQIARAAQGSMRDALSLFDQAIAYTDGTITAEVATEALGIIDRKIVVEITDAILARDPEAALGGVARAYDAGFDLRQLLGELVEEFRHLVVARAVAQPAPLIDLPEREVSLIAERAQRIDSADLQRLFRMALDNVDTVARADSPRLVLDVLAARMASIPPYRTLEELSALVDRLAAGGGSPSPTPPGPARRRAPTKPRDHRPPESGTGEARKQPKQPKQPSHAAPPGRSSARSDTPEVAVVDAAAPTADPAPTTHPEPPADQAPPPPGVDARWAETVAAIRGKHPALASFLEHALVVESDAGELTLYFGQAFYADAVKDGNNIREVTEAVQERYPTVRRVLVQVGDAKRDRDQVTLAEAEEAQRQESSTVRKTEALASKTVQMAVEIFGGTVLKVHEA